MPFNTVSIGIHATMHNINGQFVLEKSKMITSFIKIKTTFHNRELNITFFSLKK
jgi:hypothetical protein